MNYPTYMFTHEQFDLIIKEIFDLEKNCKLNNSYHFYHSKIDWAIYKNRYIFIDCNFDYMEEDAIFSLVQQYRNTMIQFRLSPYFYFSNGIIYYHPLLNNMVADNCNNLTNIIEDKLVLTEYAHANKYLHEIFHFIKISKNDAMHEYTFSYHLEWLDTNCFGEIEHFIPKQIRMFKNLDIQS